MFPMCFSTARSVTTSMAAIVAFERPSAISARTIGLADVAGAVLVAAGVAAGAGTRKMGRRETGQREEKDTAAAPQLSRTRTGAPRA